MAQNKDHDYYRRHMNSGKIIFLLGIKSHKDAGQISKRLKTTAGTDRR